MHPIPHPVGMTSGLSIAVDREGRIAAIGPDHEVDSRMDGCSFERCIDASWMSMVPGLGDAHTHPIHLLVVSRIMRMARFCMDVPFSAFSLPEQTNTSWEALIPDCDEGD